MELSNKLCRWVYCLLFTIPVNIHHYSSSNMHICCMYFAWDIYTCSSCTFVVVINQNILICSWVCLQLNHIFDITPFCFQSFSIFIATYTHTHTHMYVYINICVMICSSLAFSEGRSLLKSNTIDLLNVVCYNLNIYLYKVSLSWLIRWTTAYRLNITCK